MKRIDWLIIVLITFVSIYTLKDLFKPEFYTSHDGSHQIVRLYYFDQDIKDGQIPPRWAGGLLNGYGYPLFIFSYQFPWFIAEPIHIAGLSIIDSIKMTFLAGFILSGIFMYVYQKEVFGRIAAVGGSVIYLFAPYRFSNIFVRAAIGDATSFIFPPLMFLSLFKLRTIKKFDWKWISLGALSLAGILLSHALVFFFYFLFYLTYILYWIILGKNKKFFLLSNLGIITFGFGLSSYYLVPSLLEKNLTVFSQSFGTLVSDSFLSISQLIYSPWGYGTQRAPEGRMSFQIGIAQIFVIILSLAVISYSMLKKKSIPLSPNDKDSFILIILLFLSVLLMLPISFPFWKTVSSFIQMDFSWRVLAVIVFIISILGGYLLSKVKYATLATIFIIALAMYANRNHLRINKTLNWTVPFYLKLEKTTNSYDEYTPKWLNKNITDERRPRIELLKDGGTISVIRNSSNYVSASVDSAQSGSIRINTIYYPGWRALINGKNVATYPDTDGLMEFPVKKGINYIVLQLSETPLRLIGDILSLISVFLIVFLCFRPKNFKSF